MNKMNFFWHKIFGVALCCLGVLLALICLMLLTEKDIFSIFFLICAIICIVPGIHLLKSSNQTQAQSTENANEFYQQKIAEAEQYYNDKKLEADNYYNSKQEEAIQYYNNKKLEADSYYSNKQEETERYIEKRNNDLTTLEQQLLTLQDQLAELEEMDLIQYSQIYIDKNKTSEQYRNELAVLKLNETNLVKADMAVNVFLEQSRKSANDNTKQILRCFNAETQIIIDSVKPNNIDKMRNKIIKSFEILNKIFAVDGLELTEKILQIKLEQLTCAYGYQIKKEAEKEEQRLIRQQMLEEERVRRELEAEKAKLEKEEKQFQNEINKLMKYMQKANEIEKQLYIDKIQSLENKLALLEKDKEQVLQREQNTRAGFVYVISNIGSFGEGIYKIGMTRRLEPMDRIKELGSASVPFEFDVHAMIFSEDAPALENILHKTFRKYEVNKVNQRKEFFRVPLSEIEKVVTENHNATVIFTEFAKAEQYRESLLIAENEHTEEYTSVNNSDYLQPEYNPEIYLHTKWGIYEKPVPYTIQVKYGYRTDAKKVF